MPAGCYRGSMRSRRGPILIAEDDEATREGLREFLHGFGYRVVAAGDGQEALNLLVDGMRPSLLIVDLAMPQLRGDELLKYVQSDPQLRLVPVVIVTATPEQLGRSAADAVVAKPLNLVALLGHVRRLTGAPKDRVGGTPS